MPQEKSPPAEASRTGVIRETDAEALSLARRLLRGAPYGALGVIEPENGYPSVSRALIATDPCGAPVILVSQLSGHTNALKADPRASLLVGEPGKGDPLAHPRLTVQCRAGTIPPDAPDYGAIRKRFLARHPKAELYVDFPDFRFIRLSPLAASLNGGFGRAYRLTADDLLIDSPASRELAQMEGDAIAHMNGEHGDAIAAYAKAFAGEASGSWHMTGIDACGFEIASGDRLHRVEFDAPLASAGQLRGILVAMAKRARAIN
ncbi:HugZ family pyridoxamine 5'-phosphate oxidase [Pararhizobium haloflavum]|uniref:HugZ family pyridoxamine 5'-phosphate oxidase n=1 Tax=Pararhizobium haloflavum TaxID=2037914 RepID=UPI001FE14D91|nr:DUF2470 domain-containing protein [Pararhizobium haloflavum]